MGDSETMPIAGTGEGEEAPGEHDDTEDEQERRPLSPEASASPVEDADNGGDGDGEPPPGDGERHPRAHESPSGDRGDAPPSYMDTVLLDIGRLSGEPPSYSDAIRGSYMIANGGSTINHHVSVYGTDSESSDSFGSYQRMVRTWGCVVMFITAVVVIVSLMALTLGSLIAFKRASGSRN